MYASFAQLQESMGASGSKTLVVAAAHDAHTLEAVFAAAGSMPIDYMLTGDAGEINRLSALLGHKAPQDRIIQAENDGDAAAKAVAYIRENQGKGPMALMKGGLQTGTLLKAVLDKEKGIRGSGVMSHLAIIESPHYHKLLGVTDGGMIPYPDLAQKRAIVSNATEFFMRLGYKMPLAAALAAVETVTDKMPETLEAAELAAVCKTGGLGDCLLEGPLSLDIALSKEAARVKGFESKVSGEADILLVPNIAAGNIFCKGLIYLGGAKLAGCVLGAAVPIVLVSRGASAEEKFLSIMLCLCAG